MAIQRTISIEEVVKKYNNGIDTFSRKANNPRGCEVVSASDIKVGDEIVIDNYFTLVTGKKQAEKSVEVDKSKFDFSDVTVEEYLIYFGYKNPKLITGTTYSVDSIGMDLPAVTVLQ